jgi:hypothetical protein
MLFTEATLHTRGWKSAIGTTRQGPETIAINMDGMVALTDYRPSVDGASRPNFCAPAQSGHNVPGRRQSLRAIFQRGPEEITRRKSDNR